MSRKSVAALGLLLLLSVLAPAQVSQVSVEPVSRDEKTATFRVTNNHATQPLTCFSIAVAVTYADGFVNHGQESECQYQPEHMLAPQASRDHTSYLSPSSIHGAITKVEVAPSLAVFQDGTSEKRDQKSWHILMDSVKSNNDGERDVVTALQQSGNDPLKAAHALEALKAKATPGSPYEHRLKTAIAYLKTSPSQEDVKAFADHVQRGYELHKPYAGLRGDK